MAFRFVDSVHGDLNRTIDLFDEDTDFGSHTGSDGFRWFNDLDESRVFFDVGSPPVARLGVLVDFDHTSEQFVFSGIDPDFNRHSFADEADA